MNVGLDRKMSDENCPYINILGANVKLQFTIEPVNDSIQFLSFFQHQKKPTICLQGGIQHPSTAKSALN
jgi:hypothetical protein